MKNMILNLLDDLGIDLKDALIAVAVSAAFGLILGWQFAVAIFFLFLLMDSMEGADFSRRAKMDIKNFLLMSLVTFFVVALPVIILLSVSMVAGVAVCIGMLVWQHQTAQPGFWYRRLLRKIGVTDV